MEGDLGTLVAHLTADISDYTSKMAEAAEHTKGSFQAALVTGELVADGLEKIGEGFVDLFKDAAQHMADLDKVQAQTTAAIKSTGEAAGISASGVHELSESLAKVSGISPEIAQAGANILLTFTGIKNSVGAGNDIFNQATSIANDMSIALGQDMKSSAIQLGKALNDPIKGVTALQRVGVTFTDTQKAQIAAMEKAGNTMGAQKLILHELNTEFGGSAVAFGQTLPGAVGRFKNAWDEVTESLMNGSMPAVREIVNIGADGFEKLADAIKENGLLEAMDKLSSPAVKEAFIGIAGAITAAMVPSMMEAVAAGGAAIVAWSPFIALAAAIAFAAKPIVDNWTELTQEFQVDWGQLSAGAQGFLDAVHNAFTQIGGIVGDVAKFIQNALGPVFDMLPSGVKQALGVVGDHMAQLPSLVLAPIHSVASTAGAAMSAAAHDVAAPWVGTFQGVPGLINKIMHAAPDAVLKNAPGMEHAGEALAAGVGSGMGKGAKSATDQAKKMADAIAAVFASIPKQMQAISLKASLGDLSPLDAAKQKVSVLSSDLQTLVKDGVNPADTRFRSLESSLSTATAGMQKLQQAADQAKTIKTLSDAFHDADLQAAAFGSTFDGNAPKVSALKTAITSLVRDGVNPASPEVQNLVTQMGALQQASDAAKKSLAIQTTIKDVGSQLAEATTKAAMLGSSFDLVGAKTSIYQSALEKLAGDGLAPTDARVLELKAHLDAINPPKPALLEFLGNLRTQTTPALDSIKGLQDGISNLGKDFGIATDGPISSFVTKSLDVVGSAATIGTSINELVPLIAGAGSVVMSLATVNVPALAASVLGGAVPAIATFGITLSAAIWPITAIAAGIAGLIAVGIAVKNNWGTITKTLSKDWQAIAAVGTVVFGPIVAAIAAVVQVGIAVRDNWTQIQAVLTKAWSVVSGAATAAFNAIEAVISVVGSAVQAVLSGLQSFLTATFTPVWNVVASAASAATGIISSAWDALGGALTATINGIIDGLNFFIGAVNKALGVFGKQIPMINQVSAATFDFGNSADTAAGQIGDMTQAAADNQKAIQSLQQTFKQGLSSTIDNSIKGFINGTQDMTTALQSGIKDAIVNGVLQATEQKAMMQGAIGSLMDQVASEAANGQDTSGTIAKIKATIPALSASLESMYGGLKDALSGFGSGAVSQAAASPTAAAKVDPVMQQYIAVASKEPADNRMTFDQFKKMTGLATGGLVTGPTMAVVGEGAYHEAVLPLSASVFAQIGQGIMAALPPAPRPAYAGAAGGGPSIGKIELHYHGSGRDSREQADEMLGQIMKALHLHGIRGR